MKTYLDLYKTSMLRNIFYNYKIIFCATDKIVLGLKNSYSKILIFHYQNLMTIFCWIQFLNLVKYFFNIVFNLIIYFNIFQISFSYCFLLNLFTFFNVILENEQNILFHISFYHSSFISLKFLYYIYFQFYINLFIIRLCIECCIFT